MEHIVIIGNGIAGVTVARHIRKNSNKKITLISDESETFFSRTALMYVYMGHMRWKDIEPYEEKFWKKNRLARKMGHVNRVDTQAKTLHFANQDTLTYDKLIIASGSVTKTYGWEGLNLQGVQGLVTKQDLEQLERNAPNKEICREAVIIGGGLIGVELAEMLHTRGINVTMLVREHAFWSSTLPDNDAAMISRHIAAHGIAMKYHTQLDKIIGDSEGRVCEVLTQDGTKIPCQLVGIATGVTPRIDFLRNSDVETDVGILVNSQLETNIEDIYAIGDCAQHRKATGRRKTIEAVWYTGRMMGEALAQTICGKEFNYNPGHWFNSAKFFDIEYQTYGWVSATKNKPDYEAQFHWKHQDDTKSITIAYHKETEILLGINTFGIRMRHEVFDRWLTEGKSVHFVVKNLKAANFDPEFYRRYEKDIIRAFEAEKVNT